MAASITDIVLIGADTFIIDREGNRHFYAHGDHRGELMHRHEELHARR